MSRLLAPAKSPMGLTVVLFTIAMLLAGCAGKRSADRMWNIPLGQWSGQGSFIYECFKSADADPDDSADGPEFDCGPVTSIVRDYPTSLTIRRAQLAGQDVVEVAILSSRGQIPDLDDRTELRFALVQNKTPREDMRLFRIVGSQFNPDRPGQPLQYDPGTPLYSASLHAEQSELVLQVVYGENFVDTFRFHDTHVDKTGVFFAPEEGLVHWSERLERR